MIESVSNPVSKMSMRAVDRFVVNGWMRIQLQSNILCKIQNPVYGVLYFSDINYH